MPDAATRSAAASNGGPRQDRLRFIDCGTFIGRPGGTPRAPARAWTAAELIAELDRVGIEAALTFHVLAREYAPSVGNARIGGELAGTPRLLPVWAVLPPHTDELPPPTELAEQLIAAGAVAARMFPAPELHAHRFFLDEWCSGETLAALERRRIPLLLDFTLFRRGEPPWRDVFEVCDNHPDLPVVLMEVQGRNNRTMYALLQRFPNLYLQTGGLTVHEGIEDICRRFGAERLVFGSGFPEKTLGAARLHVERARIHESERRLIAAGNLERLLAAIDRREAHTHAD